MAVLQQKKVTVRRAPWTADAVGYLGAAERHDTTGGLESVDMYARLRLPLFECSNEAGEILGRYVLEVQTGQRGVKNVQIVAAAGWAPGVDMSQVMIGAIEQQAALVNAEWISFQTVRPGLIRKMRRAGFAIHGTVMRKRVKAAQ